MNQPSNKMSTPEKNMPFIAGLCLIGMAVMTMAGIQPLISVGVSTGLTGITGFLYYRRLLPGQSKKLRNSAIPVADRPMMRETER